jgi:mRNA-degrading endonuclease YafQ of YafQ-DinJ toxin-antitoxin module
MFELVFSKSVDKTIKKYFVKNEQLMKKLGKALETLSLDPKHNSLNSHKVDTKNNFEVWSSWITGDWRIIWQYNEVTNEAVIICLELGTHSGKSGIYR